ncbi:hypothetical protein [Vitiosangium sp. GDMCC 1.1324]|uniref:hypothetical protein n=1 Tax=Vitiosangium sp. (strain GDMCC 1.1324) TaxID=2138576 RepID=UPI00130E754C|nr:hypothetical protein [Vitiosangium sp. GDMCC 1.1324]
MGDLSDTVEPIVSIAKLDDEPTIECLMEVLETKLPQFLPVEHLCRSVRPCLFK